jgi:hypothetical protein
MVMSYRTIKQRVTGSVTQPILEQIVEYVELAIPKLLGKQQWDGFFKEMVLLTIDKDLTAVGSGALKTPMDHNLSITWSLSTYTKRIQATLYEWAVSHINIGSSEEWNEIATNVKRPKKLESVHLGLDFTDFSLARRNGRTKTSMYWSFKLNGPLAIYGSAGWQYSDPLDARWLQP